MKIVSVVGTRPQFIKASALSRKLTKKFTEILVHTGQHYDYQLSKVFFEKLHMKVPKYNLGVGSGTHGYQTGEMLKRLEKVLQKEKPALVLTYGDTNSTLAGALVASKLRLKTAHVEAGLRSFDRKMPEEINRVITDHVSDILFAPTRTAITNLRCEGITKSVYLVGDVMCDALFYNKKLAEKSPILGEIGLKPYDYFVLTIHRAENTENQIYLKKIVNAITNINSQIVFPAHPRTIKYLKRYKLYDETKKNTILTKPLGYLDFLKLMCNAKKILTDSGGVQKEAYILKIPCLTLRNTTEWVETVRGGWNILVGTDKSRILYGVENFWPVKKQENVFGKGDASRKITKILVRELEGK